MQIENITVNSIANNSAKLVQCVGVSTHEKASIGIKIRFSGKPDSSARISTLINTKLHKGITFCNINVQCSELQAALLLREYLQAINVQEKTLDLIPTHDIDAVTVFINKFSTTEQDNARQACNDNNIQIVENSLKTEYA
jgi:hypothetical protein